MGTGGPDPSILARLRSRLSSPRQLHSPPHASAAAAALPAGGRIRPASGVFGGLGLSDPAFLRNVLPPFEGGDLRVPCFPRVGGPEPRGGGKSRLRARPATDLRALRRSPPRGGRHSRDGPHACPDRVLGGKGRGGSRRAALPARNPPPPSRALAESLRGARRSAQPPSELRGRAQPAARGKRARPRASGRALRRQ